MMLSATVAVGIAASNKRKCSERCPCQQFKSDDERILSSAIESDAKANTLISWLAGSKGKEEVADTTSDNTSCCCVNRLRASIAILNAIRDASRPFLETTTANTNQNTRTTNKVSTTKERPADDQVNATYEDSFPPLSFTSTTSSAPPTLLVGRKKKKDQKNSVRHHRQEQPGSDQDNATYEDSFVPATLASTTAAPTVLVGRKKKKNVQKNGKSNHVSESNLNTDKTVASKQANGFASSKDNGISNAVKVSSLSSQETTKTHSNTSISCSLVNEVEQLRISGQASIPAETESKPIEKEKLKRLAAIYCAILKSHLAPFILLELHLILRLISLSDTKEKSQSRPINSKTHAIDGIFQSEACCIFFVSQTLVSLEGMITNMGYEAIKMLLALPALQQHCPTLVAALSDTINKDRAALLFETGQKALGSDSKTPHLTLPFDYKRDSRHNFRSLDLSRLFKEREELRDSFLYQLRAFQEVRGKLIGNEESDNIINSIKQEARDIMKNVSAGNIEWFVNLFCDLLLQIGLLPIGETDSEVLKHVTDKKRLQKLHMRFTSKSGQKSKSSRKLSLDQKGSSFNDVTPEQSFQGHQEFFLIVLQAGDSYRFNTYLKRRLAQSISELSTVNETKGLCLHIAKLQLLAKFLGFLVFSPNWDLTSEGQCDVLADSLPPLDLKMHLTNSWKAYRLVLDIPWVVKFLGMMRWDASSKKLSYYVDIFQLLRDIHIRNNEVDRHLQSNMLMINMQLEALFHDVVGLVVTQNLPTSELPLRAAIIPVDSSTGSSPSFNQPKSLPFDTMPLWFNKQFLITSIPYVEDLFQLLSDLTSNNIKLGSSCTKKVRPRSISWGTLNSGQKYMTRLSLSGDVSPSPSPWSSSRHGTPTDKHGIKERLVDSFFHQHKVLQELCEVIVDRVIKNASDTIKFSCIQPIFSKGGTDYEEYFNSPSKLSFEDYKKLLESLGDDCKEAGDKMIKDSFSQTIKGALTLLAPPDTDSHVLEIASSLAVSHAAKLGERIVRTAISDEKTKLSEEFIRKESKAKAGVPLQHSSTPTLPTEKLSDDKSVVGPKFQTLIELTAMLNVVRDEKVCSEMEFMRLKEQKEKATAYTKRFFIGCEPSRQAIRNFESQVLSYVKSFFAEPGKYITPMRAAAEVMDILSLLNMMGYLSSSAAELESLFCSTKNVQTLLLNGPLTSVELGNLLFVMIEGSLISHLSLEEIFLQLIRTDDSAKEVALSLFQLQDSNGQAKMVRLRKLLK